MDEKIFNPDAWLQLGLGGAALFILFIFVIVFMWLYVRSNNKNINNLCSKIDKLADGIAEVTKSLATTVIKVTEDQNNNNNYLRQILDCVHETKGSVDSLASKTDALLELKCRPLNKH